MISIMWRLILAYFQVSASPTSACPQSPSVRSGDSFIPRKCTVSEDSNFGEEMEYSQALFLCSAADAGSTIDYSKLANIDDGVVDSPPSLGPSHVLSRSPSPLRTQSWTPSLRGRSPSPTEVDPRSCMTPQRKLYDNVINPASAATHAIVTASVGVHGLRTATSKSASTIPGVLTKASKTRHLSPTLPSLMRPQGKRKKVDGGDSNPCSSSLPYFRCSKSFYGQSQPPLCAHP